MEGGLMPELLQHLQRKSTRLMDFIACDDFKNLSYESEI
jgi:hypothetical protein